MAVGSHNALPIIPWMDSWAMILNHYKTVYELMDGELREQNARGFPSCFNLFAREACNGAPARLQEPCLAFLGKGGHTQAAGHLWTCALTPQCPYFSLLERTQENQTDVCGRFSVADQRRQGAVGFVLGAAPSLIWALGVAGQGYISGLEGNWALWFPLMFTASLNLHYKNTTPSLWSKIAWDSRFFLFCTSSD